jgi:hypothetical protein
MTTRFSWEDPDRQPLREAIYTRAVASLPSGIDLGYVPRDLHLQWVDLEMLTDGLVDQVRDLYDRSLREELGDGLARYIRALLPDAAERALLEEDPELLGELEREIRERDLAEPLEQALRQTGVRHFCYRFRFQVQGGRLRPGNLERQARRLAAECGVDLDANREALIPLINGAGAGDRLCIHWRASPQAVLGPLLEAWDHGTWLEMAWVDPHATFGATGREVQLRGTIVRRLSLRGHALGMLPESWEDVHTKPPEAYLTPFSVREVPRIAARGLL